MAPAGSRGHTQSQQFPSWEGEGGVVGFFILPSFIPLSLCKFLPFVLFLFSPPSFFLSLFYLFFLTGIGLQLIFHVLVIFECQCQVSQSSF